MKLYYYSHGDEQHGPFSYEELQNEPVHPGTLIWYQGLKTWTPAGQLEELNDLLASAETRADIVSAEGPLDAPPLSQMPKNYLVESILATLFCCLPLGIVSIINAAKVESAWKAGQFDEAINASQQAKKWATYSLVAGLIGMGLYFIYFVAILGLNFTGF